MASLDLVSVGISRKHVLKSQIIVKEKQKLDKTVVLFYSFYKESPQRRSCLALGECTRPQLKPFNLMNFLQHFDLHGWFMKVTYFSTKHIIHIWSK